jgi:hypothetical protein
MGKTFFEGTMPALAAAARVIAAHLSKNEVEEAKALEARIDDKFWRQAFLIRLGALHPDVVAPIDLAAKEADRALEAYQARRAKLRANTG